MPASAHAAILQAAALAHPLECCGLLLGREACIARAVPAPNIATDPARHFEIAPEALVAAHRTARSEPALQVLGYYHSHPNGLDRPSTRDAQDAAHDGRIWAIAAAGAVTLWRDEASGFAPLSYAVTDG